MNKVAIAISILLLTGLLHLDIFPGNSKFMIFDEFKVEYQKSYEKVGEEQYRRYVFFRNLENIELHNADPHKTYTQGINQFADLTPQEFEALYLSLRAPHTLQLSSELLPESEIVKESIDWVAAGKVNPVQDQGACGASWAFSAVGAIQSAYMIKGTKQIKLSQQEMLDCTVDYGNYGCNGGFMSNTFKYVSEKGIHSAQDYPYLGRFQNCKQVTGNIWKVSTYSEGKGCDFLMNGLMKGPVSVGVDASNFYSYKSGIITKCGNTPNSGSTVVGVTNTYWLLKESFGAKFGDNGYVRIAPGNTCAVCQMVSYPQL